MLRDQLVLNAEIIPWIPPPARAGAVQAPAIPPAQAKLNAASPARRSSETEQPEEFGRKEIAGSAAVNSPSLCSALGKKRLLIHGFAPPWH